MLLPQDEKNQVLVSNVWIRQVSDFYDLSFGFLIDSHSAEQFVLVLYSTICVYQDGHHHPQLPSVTLITISYPYYPQLPSSPSLTLITLSNPHYPHYTLSYPHHPHYPQLPSLPPVTLITISRIMRPRRERDV